MLKRLNKNIKGFTLMELIIVMSVIAVLVVLAIPKFDDFVEKAYLTQIKNDSKVVQTAFIVDSFDDDVEDMYDSKTLREGQYNYYLNGDRISPESANDLFDKANLAKSFSESYVKQKTKTKLGGEFFVIDGNILYEDDKEVKTKVNDIDINDYIDDSFNTSNNNGGSNGNESEGGDDNNSEGGGGGNNNGDGSGPIINNEEAQKLREEIEKLKCKISGLNKKIENLNKDKDRLETENSELKGQKEELEREKGELKDKLANLEKENNEKIEKLEEELAKIKKELEEKIKDLEDKNKELEDKNNKINELEKEKEDLEGNNSNLEELQKKFDEMLMREIREDIKNLTVDNKDEEAPQIREKIKLLEKEGNRETMNNELESKLNKLIKEEEERNSGKIIDITVKDNHSSKTKYYLALAALKPDDTIVVAGNSIERDNRIKVNNMKDLNNSPENELQNNTPYQITYFKDKGIKIKSIHMGYKVFLVLTQDGDVYYLGELNDVKTNGEFKKIEKDTNEIDFNNIDRIVMAEDQIRAYSESYVEDIIYAITKDNELYVIRDEAMGYKQIKKITEIDGLNPYDINDIKDIQFSIIGINGDNNTDSKGYGEIRYILTKNGGEIYIKTKNGFDGYRRQFNSIVESISTVNHTTDISYDKFTKLKGLNSYSGVNTKIEEIISYDSGFIFRNSENSYYSVGKNSFFHESLSASNTSVREPIQLQVKNEKNIGIDFNNIKDIYPHSQRIFYLKRGQSLMLSGSVGATILDNKGDLWQFGWSTTDKDLCSNLAVRDINNSDKFNALQEIPFPMDSSGLPTGSQPQKIEFVAINQNIKEGVVNINTHPIKFKKVVNSGSTVDFGQNLILALTEDGEVYAWTNYNDYGVRLLKGLVVDASNDKSIDKSIGIYKIPRRLDLLYEYIDPREDMQ